MHMIERMIGAFISLIIVLIMLDLFFFGWVLIDEPILEQISQALWIWL